MIIFFIEGEHKTFFYVFDVKFKILTIDQKNRYAGTAVPVSPECPHNSVPKWSDFFGLWSEIGPFWAKRSENGPILHSKV